MSQVNRTRISIAKVSGYVGIYSNHSGNVAEGMEGVVGIVRDTKVYENYYCNKRPQGAPETNETA